MKHKWYEWLLLVAIVFGYDSIAAAGTVQPHGGPIGDLQDTVVSSGAAVSLDDNTPLNLGDDKDGVIVFDATDLEISSAGDLSLGVKIDTKTVTIDTFGNCATDTVTIIVDEITSTCVENDTPSAVQWDAVTDNDTSATNLAVCINAISGISATATTNVVTVTHPLIVTIYLNLAINDATCATVSNGTDGEVNVYGTINLVGNLDLNGATRAVIFDADADTKCFAVSDDNLRCQAGGQTVWTLSANEQVMFAGKSIRLQGSSRVYDSSAALSVGTTFTTTHGLVSGDWGTGGATELDGPLWVDSTSTFAGTAVFTGASAMTFGDDTLIQFGNGIQGGIDSDTGQTPDSLLFLTGSESNAVVVVEFADRGFDFAHAQTTNPTWFYHSANQSTTEWTSVSHIQTGGLIATGGGDLTLDPTASLNVTLTAADADAFTANDGTTNYYNIDTLTTTSGTHAHIFDNTNVVLANIPTASFTQVMLNGYSSNITTNADDITGSFSTQIHVQRTTLSSDTASTNYTGVVSSIRIRGPAAGPNVILDDMVGIHIEDGGGAGGTETVQHGINIDTLAAGTTNYPITVGNTDVDQNLIHVGVTGDPILSWNEADDTFGFNNSVVITEPGAANETIGLAITGTAALFEGDHSAGNTGGLLVLDIDRTDSTGYDFFVVKNDSGNRVIIRGDGRLDLTGGSLSFDGRAGLNSTSRTFLYSDMTDGGGASGTIDFTDAIPDGAITLRSICHTLTGFANDTSATIQVGDGTDVDRYNTGTPNVFTTNVSGTDMGVTSGTAWHDNAVTVTVTITTAADFTSVNAGAVTCAVFYWTP